MRYRAQQKGLELVCTLSETIPPTLVGDPGRLHQVLVNLVGNAIKFTNEGKVGVQVNGDSREAEEIYLHFTVQDTGVGISPEMQEAIFAPFTQGDNSTARKFGGTGLGLAITRRLVEMMDGKIWTERDAAGPGTIFHFTARVGVGQAPVAGKKTHPGGPEAVAPAVAATPPLRVLLAEDNPVNQVLAVRLLEKQHHKVTVARTGAEAVAAVKQGGFDLVLMDVQMPEMDGLEATGIIREWEGTAGGHLPIVAVTAHAIKGDEERCLRAGTDAYISKPINPKQLFEVISRLSATERSGPAKDAADCIMAG